MTLETRVNDNNNVNEAQLKCGNVKPRPLETSRFTVSKCQFLLPIFTLAHSKINYQIIISKKLLGLLGLGFGSGFILYAWNDIPINIGIIKRSNQ